jgi:hypothetical protein
LGACFSIAVFTAQNQSEKSPPAEQGANLPEAELFFGNNAEILICA